MVKLVDKTGMEIKIEQLAEKLSDEDLEYLIKFAQNRKQVITVVTKEPEIKTKPETESPDPIPSIWNRGALISGIVTLIYAVNTFSNSTSAIETGGSLTIGLIVTFLFWWVVFAGIVWVWRKITK